MKPRWLIASAMAGLWVTTVVSTPRSTRLLAMMPPMPPQPMTSTRGEVRWLMGRRIMPGRRGARNPGMKVRMNGHQ